MTPGAVLLLFLLAAQAHEWPEQKDNATQQEKCRDSCRKTHCDQWTQCNDIEDAKAREECKDRTTEDESRCRSQCGEPRT